MRRPILVFLCLLASMPAYAGFDEVVRAVQIETGIRPIRIPFLGLARLVCWVVSPAGIHDFQVANFEGSRKGREERDPAHLESILRQRAGAGFQPLVRAHSRRNNEWTFIFARPAGDRIELIIAAREGEDTTVVRAVVNPDKMLRHLHEPDSVVRVARH